MLKQASPGGYSERKSPVNVFSNGSKKTLAFQAIMFDIREARERLP